MSITYSWEKIKQDTRILAKKLDPSEIDTIVAVTRGGLFIAGLLSYLLDKRIIYTYGVKTYEGRVATEATTLFKPPIRQDDPRVLIVDDLVDKGLTMKHISIQYPSAKKAVLYVQKSLTDLVDAYVSIKPDDWITFPWDMG